METREAAATKSPIGVASVTAAVSAFGPPQAPAATPSPSQAKAQALTSPICETLPVPSQVEAGVASTEAEDDEGRTTVMLRNIPVACSRAELLSMLDRNSFCGRYVFVYVPVDFTRSIGIGYALVCMASALDAEQLLVDFNGLVDWGSPEHGTSPCEASWSEPRQGLSEHIERYRNSPVMHKSVPDEYKPVLFTDGVRIPFPPPTKAIRPPRIRHLKAT